MKIEENIAIVTGGAQGLGRTYADALLNKGAKVMIADVQDKEGLEAVRELQAKYGGDSCKFVHVDVTSEDQVTDMFKTTSSQLGAPSIIINNAGIVDEHNWRKLVDVNLKGVIQVLWSGMDAMSKKNGKAGGVIVNTASVAAFVNIPHIPVYCASKAGVMQLTRSVGTPVFFEKHGVRVNCLCPSFTETPLTTAASLSKSSDYDTEVCLAAATGMLRPSDVITPALRLIEDDSLNGEVMVVTHAGVILHQFQTIDL